MVSSAWLSDLQISRAQLKNLLKMDDKTLSDLSGMDYDNFSDYVTHLQYEYNSWTDVIGGAMQESKANESDGMQVDWWDSLSQDERSNYMNSFSQINNTYPVSGSIYMDNYDEMDSSNQYYVKNLFTFVRDDMDNDLLGRNHNILGESWTDELDEIEIIMDHFEPHGDSNSPILKCEYCNYEIKCNAELSMSMFSTRIQRDTKSHMVDYHIDKLESVASATTNESKADESEDDFDRRYRELGGPSDDQIQKDWWQMIGERNGILDVFSRVGISNNYDEFGIVSWDELTSEDKQKIIGHYKNDDMFEALSSDGWYSYLDELWGESYSKASEKGETYHFMWNHKQVRSQLLAQAGLSDEHSNKEWDEIPEEDKTVLKLIMNDMFYSNDYNTESKANEGIDCMMGGKHKPIDSPNQMYPYESCTKCGDNIQNIKGEWTNIDYKERQNHANMKDKKDFDRKLDSFNLDSRESSGIPSEDLESTHDLDNLFIEWNKDFDGSRQEFMVYADSKGFDAEQAGGIYDIQYVGETNESWSQKSSIDRIEALEKLGIKQGDAIKLSGLEFEDFGEDLQGALKDEDKEEYVEVANPNSEFQQYYPDYNNIGESQTARTKYECEYCDHGFRSNEALSIHHNDQHAIAPESLDGYATEKKGSCKTCGMQFTEEDYKNAEDGEPSPVGDYDDECYNCQLGASEADPDFQNDPDFQGYTKDEDGNKVKSHPSQYTASGWDNEKKERMNARGDVDGSEFYASEHNVGDYVTMTDDALDNYGQQYKGQSFRISHVAKSVDDHRGYDEGMGGENLYDFDGFNSSLYDYEVESANESKATEGLIPYQELLNHTRVDKEGDFVLCNYCNQTYDLGEMDELIDNNTITKHLHGHGIVSPVVTAYDVLKDTESKASEFNIGTTMICPICKKEIETGNEDSFYHGGNFYDPNSVPMSYKMQDHFEQEHTPEDFGVQNKNFKGASDGYEAFEDWKTGNQLSLAFRNSFPEYNQDDAIMMNNADKYSTLDSDGNRMPDDYEGESKASEGLIDDLDDFQSNYDGKPKLNDWLEFVFQINNYDKKIYHKLEAEATQVWKKYTGESKASEATLVYTKGKGELTSTVKDADSDVLRQWMKDQEDNPEQADNYKAVKKLLKDRGESNEAGSEDHGCADCGFTTSDNSEYIDHLNSHEE